MQNYYFDSRGKCSNFWHTALVHTLPPEFDEKLGSTNHVGAIYNLVKLDRLIYICIHIYEYNCIA